MKQLTGRIEATLFTLLVAVLAACTYLVVHDLDEHKECIEDLYERLEAVERRQTKQEPVPSGTTHPTQKKGKVR